MSTQNERAGGGGTVTTLVDLVYGGMPPIPEHVETDLLYEHSRAVSRWADASLQQWRISSRIAGSAVAFTAEVLLPTDSDDDGFRVVVCGDGCWPTMTDAVITEVIGRGFALVRFNRVELAHDRNAPREQWGLATAAANSTFGAIAAWAWGYHRCVDLIEQHESLDPSRIAITGHSRGGKAVLLAAATDPRIAAVAANNSGCAGAGSFKIRGEGCERIADITHMFPYWFGPEFAAYADREGDLPFDQHVLLSAIAPRAVLTLEAEGDRWANPDGTARTHDQARPAFEALGVPSRLRLASRPGGHGHLLEDWTRSLDFFAEMLP